MNILIYEIIGGLTKIDCIETYLHSIQQFAKRHSLHIQIFNAAMIYGKRHIQSAVEHAIRAMNEKRMSTQSMEMEVLLYAAGERQLNHAIPKMGIKSGEITVVIVFLAEHNQRKDLYVARNLFVKDFLIHEDDAVLIPSIDTLDRWGFSKEEMEAVEIESYEDLILERVAMVDIIK